MKIAWFTPFSHDSAIGGCSQLIVAELARVADVEVWHPPADDLRTADVRMHTIKRPVEASREILRSYDLLVYNFGNHLGFHRDIFEVSRQFPGVVILHDFVLHHFFADYCLRERRNPEEYLSAMEHWYGEKGRRTAQASLGHRGVPVWETDAVVGYPLFEEAIAGMCGVITHSEFLRRKVRAVFPGEVDALPLPRNVEGQGSGRTRADLGIAEGSLLLVTVGQVNENKRVHAVVDVLGKNRKAFRDVRYVIIGPYEEAYHRRLRSKVQAYGLEGTVSFTGYQPDDVLHSYIRLSDVCVNLRHPTFEGASASVIEEMLHGKPVVVTDAGFYSELPDDTVVKINPTTEYHDLTKALRRLADEPGLRGNLGARAGSYAKERFRASRYVQALMPFFHKVCSQAPLLQLVDRVALELQTMDVQADMDVVGTVANEISRLFGSDGVFPHDRAEP